MNGVRRDSSSNRSRSSDAPARPAIATRWMIALVDPPSAIAAVTAFSNAAVVMMSRGFRSSHTISTMRRPAADAMRGCAESAAGIDEAPGSVMPSASTVAAIVDAVPIVMQVPNERAMPSSISRQAQSSSRPARFSSQYFQASVPDPRIWPRQLPRSIGPAGTKIAGRFALVAPMTSAGTVLSQPPSRIDAVGRIGAQRFFRVHREQVAVEHRARLHEGLAEREQRDLHGEAARLPDAALDVLGAQAEMRVARVGVAPGIQDRDDRLAGDVLRAEPGLLRARAMTERSEIVAAEPAVAAQIRGCLHAASWSWRSRLPQRARHRARAAAAAPSSSAETYGGIGPVVATSASSVAWCSTRAGPQSVAQIFQRHERRRAALPPASSRRRPRR